MNRSSHEFFARAAFTKDKHVGLRGRYTRYDCAQFVYFFAFSDNASTVSGLSHFFAKNSAVKLRSLMLKRTVDLDNELVELIRFAHILECAQFHALDRAFERCVTG